MRKIILRGLTLTLGLAAASPAARAEDWSAGPSGSVGGSTTGSGGGYSVSFVERPLTLTAGAIRIDGDLPISRFSVSFAGSSVSETFIGLGLGGAYAISDDLEVSATLPLSLSPDFDLGDPQLGATYRFVKGSTELGARVAVNLPVQGDFGLNAGLPVLLRLGGKLRLDTGAFLGLAFADSTVTTLSVPASFAFQLMPDLALNATTGLVLPDLDPDKGALPLAVGAFYTLAKGSTPYVDVGATFALPAFLGFGGGGVNTDLWSLTVSGRLFLF
jgi:hypothetical protein